MSETAKRKYEENVLDERVNDQQVLSKEGTMGDLPMRTKQRKRRRRGGNRTPFVRRVHRDDPNFVKNVEKKNEKFERYYIGQGIVPSSEIPDLLKKMRDPLPSAFRITASGNMASEIQDKLKNEFRRIFEVLGPVDGEPVCPPQMLEWYPGGLAWTVNAPRQLLRRDNALSEFHRFLIAMNNQGAINRQEAVSMIPPLLLDVRPGLQTIDMCAAPGSKTAQILDMIGTGKDTMRELAKNGLVIANDADLKRCWMLAHQLKRFSSADLIVTHQEAQNFPAITLFDRVLCDVPCSGDGTLRKAPDLWRKWTPEMGNGLHRLQKRILQRGIELLKPGGRLVYSTCSMNPVENEAIVADALRTFGLANLELLDVSSELVQLKRRPGMKTWRVKDTTEDNAWFTSFGQVPYRRTSKVVKSLFPPTEEENFPLERCIRVVPQDQDTGAFFVAVFVKKQRDSSGFAPSGCAAEANAEPSQTTSMALKPGDVNSLHEPTKVTEVSKRTQVEAKDINGDTVENVHCSEILERLTPHGNARRQASRLLTDDPLCPLERMNMGALKNIAEFYGLDIDDCRHSMMSRGTRPEKFKKVLLVSQSVRYLLSYSYGSQEGAKLGRKPSLRVVHAGVRIFERTTRRDTTCPFRIVFDGLPLLLPVLEKRMVAIQHEDLVRVLRNDTLSFTSLSSREARSKLMRMSSGAAVLAIDPPHGDAIIIWKSPHAIAKLMPSEELATLKSRYCGNTSDLAVEKENTAVKGLLLGPKTAEPVADASG